MVSYLKGFHCTQLLYSFSSARPHSPSQAGAGPCIECLVAYSKGFVCSGSNGALYVFEKTDDPNTFHEVRSINISEDLNPSETTGTYT